MKKYKFMQNPGLKIMAFVFSIFLWFIVANVDNPVTHDTFSNIPVTIINDDVITQAGNVYSVLDEQSVSVVVYAQRSVLEDIDAEDIVATADIEEMDTSTGLVPITVSIPKYSGDYTSVESVPRNLRIQTEKTNKKVLSLTVRSEGEARDGYVLGDMTVNPERITITGPESKIEQITRAVAKIDTEGLSEDKIVKAELELYDENDNIVDQSQLSNNLGEEGITVEVEVLRRKNVSLNFDVSGSPADGYQYMGCTSEPELIDIFGDSEVIADVDSIDIPASEINITDATENVQTTIDIRPYLPEGISLVDDNSANVLVTAQIEKEGTRTIRLLVSSIRIDNLADHLRVEYEADAEVSFQFQGDQDALDVLDISNGVSVDLSDYSSPGTYDVPVSVIMPDRIELINEPTVQLTLVSDSEEEPSNGQSGTSDSGTEENPGTGTEGTDGDSSAQEQTE